MMTYSAILVSKNIDVSGNSFLGHTGPLKVYADGLIGVPVSPQRIEKTGKLFGSKEFRS
jgi:hypothetical protein